MVRGQPGVHDSHLVDLLRWDRGAGRWRLAAGQGSLGSLRQLGRRRELAPVDHPAGDDPEGVPAALDRVTREHQSRSGVGCLEQTTEANDQRGEAIAPPQQDGGSLVALGRGGLLHLPLDVLDQVLAIGAWAGERGERLVESAAVEVRIEVL